MGKKILLLICIMCATVKFTFAQYQLTDITPEYSGTINANCFLIGNTNTQLEALIGKTTADITQEIEYEGELSHIKNCPKNLDGITIENCNYADFCISMPNECGSGSIEDARITWGGRENKPLSSNSIFIKITDDNGNTLPLSDPSLSSFIEITGTPKYKTPSKSPQNDGFYVIHQNITDTIKAIIQDPLFPGNGNYRIYVANVPVKTKRVENVGEDAGQFCGWNFSLVYKHPLLPRRSIMVYDTDLFQESTSAGNTPDPIFCSFKFGNSIPYSIDDTISFSFSSLGGMFLQTSDCMRLNRDGDMMSSLPNDKKYYGKADKIQFNDMEITENGATVDENPFRCMINYLYRSRGCDIKAYNPYARGFDLTKTTLSPIKLKPFNYIAKNGTEFNVTITPTQEYHLFTNALVYIGAPDAPEAALPMEVDATDIEPDKDFSCTLYLKTGDNKNGLSNINIRVPISEYVDSIVDFNISFHSLVQNTSGTNSNNSYPSISTITNDTKSTKSAQNTVRNWNQANNSQFVSQTRSFINSYLESVDKINDNYATTKPSVLKTREIVFSFDNLIIPKTVSDTNAIIITIKLHSKKETDPIYNQKTYIGGTPQVIPQAELDLTDDVTKDTSIFESSYNKNINWNQYKCDLNGSGGGGNGSLNGGGSCNGLNGDHASGTGIYKKNETELIEININAKGNCRETPDSIKIHFCDELTITPFSIKQQLSKMDFDLDSIRKADSCIWERVKREKLVDFASEHGVNRALLEQLLSNYDNSIQMIDTTKAWQQFFNCQAPLDAKDVDSIVNMKIEFSDIYVLFKENSLKDDTSSQNVYQKSDFIKLSDETTLNEIFTIKNDTTVYIYYKSPWKSGEKSCSEFIPIQFNKDRLKDPIIVYNNDTILPYDTIYSCLGNELSHIIIKKSFQDYNLYATILDTIGGSAETVFNDLIDKTYRKDVDWDIQKTLAINTDIPGTRTLIFKQKDLSNSCLDDGDTIFVKILDLKIDEVPDLTANTETEFCRSSRAEDSIPLKVTKDASHADYQVLWYIVTKDESNVIRTRIGEGDEIKVPRDTIFDGKQITIRYEATYFKDHCESNPNHIDILLNNTADSVQTDTMTICQYYKLKESEVIDQLKAWNNNRKYTTDSLVFYPYYDVMGGDIQANMAEAIKKDSVSLSKLLNEMDTHTGCAVDGMRFTHFVVRGNTDKGCMGDPSIVTVKINCYNNIAPKFSSEENFIRYCTGDTPLTEFNDYLSETNDFKTGYKWVWVAIADSVKLPYNNYNSTAYSTAISGGNPATNTAIANSEKYMVARIDSNNCVSEKDSFEIIVADAITSFAMVGDTTTVINTNDPEYALNFCVGANPYSSKTLPAVGYPSREYILEWFRKDLQVDDCDTLSKYKKNRLAPSIDIDFNKADTLFYCLRQSTSMGCKGPWLNVSIYIHENVKETPEIDTVQMCEGEFAKGFHITPPTDPNLMLYLYGEDKTTEVLESEMVVDTVPGKYLFSEKNSLYYAQYKDKITQCYGEMIGTNAIVHKKPHLPQMNEDTTVYLCANGDTVNLTQRIEAAINSLDYDTKIEWTPNDTVIAKGDINTTYQLYQRDTFSQCVGDPIEITVKVSNTIKYKAIGTKALCFGESISLIDTVQRNVRHNDNVISKDSIKFHIYLLNGNSRGIEITGDIISNKARHEEDTTRYLIHIVDEVSGCEVKDTATVIFHALPNATVAEQLYACQGVAITLPTPTDEAYNYTWKREDGDKISGVPTLLTLMADEKISLTEENKLTGCKDTFYVDVTAYPTPASAITKDTAFCQNNEMKEVKVTVQTSEDGYNNKSSNFQLQWFDAQMDSVENPLKMDTIVMNEVTRALKYTVRQRNTITQCYKDTTITVTLKKSPKLAMEDLAAVCEPESISLVQKVNEYLSNHLNSTDLGNLNGLQIQYGKIINGTASTLNETEAEAIHYTDGIDSVRYTYTVTDENHICSASDTLYITINKKPLTPVIESGVDTIYFCQDNAPIRIGAENKNEEKYPTQIHWGDYQSTITGDSLTITNRFGNYTAFTKNEATGCVSDFDTIHAVISLPIEFTPIQPQHLCYRDSLDLYGMVKKQVDNNTQNSKYDLRFNIYKMSGSVPLSTPIVKKVASNKAIHETDTTRYLIEIADQVSGCEFSDTVTVIFHGLPVIDPIADIEVCQYQDTALPTPDKGYQYEWFRASDDMRINAPSRFNTDVKEYLYLKATEQFAENNLTCYDSTMVYMDVKTIPVAAIVKSDTFCQNSGEHLIPVELKESLDNEKKDLSIQWFNESGQAIVHPINTDSVEVVGKSLTVKYTIRQYNKITACYKDTSVPFVVNKAIHLEMADFKAVCQPEVVDFRGKVLDYLTSANTNISNISNCDITFGKIVNLNESALTDEEANQISYTEGIDSVLYVYHVKDDVCESADSVYITINEKPTTPLIEKGIDTIYFCASNQEMQLVATQENDKSKTKIFWGDYSSNTFGDTLSIAYNAPIAKYTAFSKNIQSGCTSGFDTIVAVIKDTIKVDPIGDRGTIVRCEGEVIDLYELAMASFHINKSTQSQIIFSATENGYPISEGELTHVSRTKQDTSLYLFSVEDDITGCSATNRLTLIYHKNPTFSIEGREVLCEGENIELKAMGDNRPVTYAWTFEGSTTIVNTTDSFSFRNITHDTTVVLIEKLNGTSCADTLSKAIQVNVAPTPLGDTTLAMCQDTAAKRDEVIDMNRSNDEIQGYLIKWYAEDETLLSEKESIEVDKRKAATYRYQVESINKRTKCVSQRSNVIVTIHPQITIGLDHPDTICQPFTYDLAGNLAPTISGGTRPTYVNTTLNGEVVSNDDAIAESGVYTVHYTDENQCEASKEISVQFHEQPATPQLIGDTILCQNGPTAKLTAKKTGSNSVSQTFEWKSAANTTLSDTLYIATENYGKTPYTLRAVDKKTQCYSEPISFNFDIREGIGFSPIGLLEGCHATTIDLEKALAKAYSGSSEEKILSYFYVTEANSLSAITHPNELSKSGRYVVKANETESGCERIDTIQVLFHDSLAIYTEGNTIICQGDEVKGLKALNAEDYTWVRGNGTTASGAAFPFATTVSRSETFQIIGEKKVGTLFCKDSINVEITVNENPSILPDTTLYLCQDTAGAAQSIARNVQARENEKLALVWFNAAGDTLFNGTEEAVTPVTEVASYQYHVSQVNKETQCTNKSALVTVNVLPQITTNLADTTTCVPNSINLVKIAEKGAKAGEYTGDIQIIDYERMENGKAINVNGEADSLSQEGTYRVRYQYESNGATCSSEGVIHLYFNKQPIQPSIADQNFCQNTGDHELTGKVNTTQVRLLWEDLSVYPSRIDTNTTFVSTEIATQKRFAIRQIQDLSGCISMADTALITIYPAIESLDKDTAICYGESVNLNDFAKGSYFGGTKKHSVTFKNADGQSFDPEKVEKSNTYFALFADSINLCHDTATFTIHVDQPVRLTTEGAGNACTDQSVTLKVSGAEQYEWSNGEKGDKIVVTSNEAATKQFTVAGRRQFHDIYCAADTTLTLTFHDAVTPRALTYDTCAGNQVTLEDIILKNNIQETVDTIWNVSEQIRYSNLKQNLGKSGSYEFAVHNEEGCQAHHTLEVKMHQVENLKVDKQESTYCYGALANFTATGENIRSIEWNNLTDEIVVEGTRYNEPITSITDFMLVATEAELGCKDTLRFSVEAYPKKEISIAGDRYGCRDSVVILTAESALTDVQWNFGDTIFKGKSINFIADQTRTVQLTGTDEHGCFISEPVTIDVAYLEDPIIQYDRIKETEYALSDDVNEVELRETSNVNGSELIEYQWNFGDGKSWTEEGSNHISHTYSDTIIRSRRDLLVNLTIAHQYGCKKSTSTVLKIDPFIFIPNTMVADGEYIFMENYDLQIYDRVGTLVYQGRGWDGTYKGMPASEDTYFYAITYYEKGEKIIKTGFITLVR